MVGMDVYAETVKSAIQERACSLNALGKFVFENPELQFEEHKAHHFIANYLEQEGFLVQRKYILETAFRAEYGRKHPVVVLLCEYDALPNIGHACGHHLIAESAVAAGIGVKEVLQRDSSLPGKVVVLGTPAEEAGHGKAYLIDGGAFEGADVAMMIHPAPVNIAVFPSLALATLRVEYRGKESHSGATPWEGINALDAAVGAYVNLSMLRQQMKPSWKLGATISDKDSRANVTPSVYSMEVTIRAPKSHELAELKSKVEACLNSAATATGCGVDVTLKDPIAQDVVTNTALVKVYQKNAEKLDAARVQTSYELTLTAAQALSLTALEVIRDPKLLKKVKDEFQENQTQK
ncbi:peptidase M20 domain-containing protein 2-like [Ixodes scapularis]|uniref:peptidase M20 domain-containing protein 2-like n=1 Tax=Ixodes scapularis TaxID=6945 RepID=UPI001C380E6D|nr:peptidase M20 domain-containing protein 2-like [Ixodes scapularis]